jgi:allantoate deiminase
VLERLAHVDPDAPRPIGIVSAITGTGRLHVTITGRPDHSGTTPMIGRKDAFLGAAEIALALREMALGVGHPAVMTVGRIELSPNIPNVVAGAARFTVDVRHPDPHVHRSMLTAAMSRCHEAAHARGLDCEVEEMWCQPPAHMAPDLVERVRAAATGRGYRAVDIVSGAGHDSQIIARRFPTAMLFVVTAHGRSHCPDEHASAEDCTAGVEVLADVLRDLAY